MELRLLNVVVMAEDYEGLRDWYVEALDLTVKGEWTEKYHYAELVSAGRFVVGIASAKEMNVTPGDRKSFTVTGQLVDDDVRVLARMKGKGGDVPFGPSFDEDGQFWFGGFGDLEGNPWWVVEEGAVAK
ncbi:MAG: VOC family protein [Planctomycetota bacterium]